MERVRRADLQMLCLASIAGEKRSAGKKFRGRPEQPLEEADYLVTQRRVYGRKGKWKR
jgi:hypothetical protein